MQISKEAGIVTRSSEALQNNYYFSMIGYDYRWYVLKVKSQHERKVLEYCISRNIHAYLPLRKCLRIWSDRKRWLDIPMIPGYLFIKSCRKELFIAASCPSVFDCVRFNGSPAIVPEEQIKIVRAIEKRETDSVSRSDLLECNDIVKIVCGPLKGMQGRINNICSNSFLIVDIPAINHSIKLKINRESVVNSSILTE